ncbi:MAG TPA: hypothetical protein VL200_07175 [Lacunisphaera sp.]|nr:hypothetical protein [Lacunisphaera sp.]
MSRRPTTSNPNTPIKADIGVTSIVGLSLARDSIYLNGDPISAGIDTAGLRDSELILN